MRRVFALVALTVKNRSHRIDVEPVFLAHMVVDLVQLVAMYMDQLAARFAFEMKTWGGVILDMGADIFETGGVGLVQKVLVDQPFIDHPFEMTVNGGNTDRHAELPEMVMDVAGCDMPSLC